jgi:hypothetical protein
MFQKVIFILYIIFASYFAALDFIFLLIVFNQVIYVFFNFQFVEKVHHYLVMWLIFAIIISLFFFNIRIADIFFENLLHLFSLIWKRFTVNTLINFRKFILINLFVKFLPKIILWIYWLKIIIIFSKISFS